MERKLRNDLKMLVRFVECFCRHHHGSAIREAVELRTHQLGELTGRPVVLCEQCGKLLAHAFHKRSSCPMDPKPACRRCPSHCYHPRYRAMIREVMKFSGRRLILTGRLHYLLHLLR